MTEILVDGKYEELIGDLTPLIMEELNIKKVVFERNWTAYMNYSLKPNFKVAGPVLGKNIKAFGARFGKADRGGTVAALEADGKIALDLNGEPIEIYNGHGRRAHQRQRRLRSRHGKQRLYDSGHDANTGADRRRSGKRTDIQGTADEKAEEF